jgi:hypothetical protein
VSDKARWCRRVFQAGVHEEGDSLGESEVSSAGCQLKSKGTEKPNNARLEKQDILFSDFKKRERERKCFWL